VSRRPKAEEGLDLPKTQGRCEGGSGNNFLLGQDGVRPVTDKEDHQRGKKVGV